MSTTANPVHSQPEPWRTRVRNFLIGTLFALVLLVPKIVHLRHSARSWMFFRIFLGIAGAALVIMPLSLWNSYVPSLVGLVAFTAAILLPPAKFTTSVDDKARELGALIVVNGGRYQPFNGPLTAAQLFVGAKRICVLDARFQTLLTIPVNEIAVAHAEESETGWLLRITWADQTAEFSYRGIFAEHLARVAETTLHGVMHPSLPVIPQHRAASA